VFIFAIFFLLLVPSTLTLLAWWNGLRMIASAGESKTGIRIRVWPAMLFLAAPLVMLLGFLWLRAGHMDMIARTNLTVWMLVIGAISSVTALVTSTWAPPGFRPIALFAAAAWVVCFGGVLMALTALSELR
jgi:hypothetical protein